MFRIAVCLLPLLFAPEGLLERLSSPDPKVRREAVVLAEGSVEPAVVERVRALAGGDANLSVRLAAVRTLGTYRSADVAGQLLEMLDDAETGVDLRRAALVALGRNGDPRAWDALLARLEARHPPVVAAAVEGLGEFGDERAFEPLGKLLDERGADPWIGAAIPKAIVAIDAPRGVELLLARLAELEPSARMAAATAIGDHGGPEAAEGLAPHLASDSQAVRRDAIRALGGVGGADARDMLVAHLTDRPADRAATAHALGRLGDAAAAPALAAELARADVAEERIRIAEALGRLGDPRAALSIAPLLDDETVLAQPKWMSAIATFPLNTRVSHAAWWALRTLLDGKPPVDVKDLSGFHRDPPALERIKADLPALRQTLAERADDPALRFPSPR